jgi:hypothetical protein
MDIGNGEKQTNKRKYDESSSNHPAARMYATCVKFYPESEIMIDRVEKVLLGQMSYVCTWRQHSYSFASSTARCMIFEDLHILLMTSSRRWADVAAAGELGMT